MLLTPGGPFIGPRYWRTLWLYDHEGVAVSSGGNPPESYDSNWARVLDYFNQLGVPTGLTAVHGAVNPNTPLREVLGSVFMNMQIDKHFDAPVSSFGNSGALDMADAIRGQVASTAPDEGPLRRISDLGRPDMADAIFDVMENIKGSALTEAEEESFYRNAAGLLNPRQNIFLILLAGKSPIAVEQRALAIVWRDPIPDSSGRHPSFIRWFTWLEE